MSRPRLSLRLPVVVFCGVWAFELVAYAVQYTITIPLKSSDIAAGALVDSFTHAALWPIGYWMAGWRVMESALWRRVLIIVITTCMLIPIRILFMKVLLTPFGWFLQAPPLIPEMLLYYGPTNFMLFSIAIASAQVLRFQEEVQARALTASRLRSALAESRLQVMKAQLHPHFLFNALHSVSALVYSDPGRADRLLARLSGLLATAFALRDEQEVTLAQELSFVEQYLEIEQIRFGERLNVEIDAAEEIRRAMVPHLALQPLVENAIRHGTSKKRGRRSVLIRVSRRDADLLILVADDGYGLDRDWREGIGLRNTRARLEELYGARAQLKVEPRQGGGTNAVILVPYRTAVE